MSVPLNSIRIKQSPIASSYFLLGYLDSEEMIRKTDLRFNFDISGVMYIRYISGFLFQKGIYEYSQVLNNNDIPFTNINELRTYIEYMCVDVSSGNGGGVSSSVTISSPILNLQSTQLEILNLLRLENWDKIAGNSKDFIYYTGVTSTNPSGAENIRNIKYITGTTTIITQTFHYDVNNKIIKIITT